MFKSIYYFKKLCVYFINFNYILQVVGNLSDNDFINWISEQKIIPDVNYLRFCPSCYNLMKLC